MSRLQLSDTDYGFNGLVRIFNEKEIEMNEWVIEKLDKERGGITSLYTGEKSILRGEIYTKLMLYLLLHKRDTIKLHSIGELYEIIDASEKSRLRVKKTIADMLMKAFKSEEE